jgi:hypothetical protein
MIDPGAAVTGAADDLGKGITALAEVAAGATLLLVGFLILTGWSKPLTRTAGRVAKVAVLHKVR